MGVLLEEYQRELSLRQSQPGFDKEVFKTEFLESRGYKRKTTAPSGGNGKGLPSRPGVIGGVKDVASHAARGLVLGAPELALNIVRTFDQPGGSTDAFREAAGRGLEGLKRIGEENKFLRRSKESEKGIRGLVTQAAEAAPLSVAASVPGAIAGGIVGQAAIPIPFLGATIGAVIGAGLNAGTLFGLANFSQTQDEIDDAIANDTSLTDADREKLAKFKNVTALKSASAEAGLEFLSGALTLATAGLFNKIPGAKQGLKNTIRGLLTKQKSAVAKALGATAIGEGGTEAATSAIQLKLRKDLGLTDANILDSSIEAFGVGALVGLFFGGGLQIAGARQRSQIKKALSNANTGRATREKAVSDIAEGIRGKGNNDAANAIAKAFEVNAKSFIDRGKPVSMDTDLGTIKQVEDIAEALIKEDITVDQAMQLRPMIAGRPELLDRFDDVVALVSKTQEQSGTKPAGTPEDVTQEGSDAADIVLDPSRDVSLEAVAEATEKEGQPKTEKDKTIEEDVPAKKEPVSKPEVLVVKAGEGEIAKEKVGDAVPEAKAEKPKGEKGVTKIYVKSSNPTLEKDLIAEARKNNVSEEDIKKLREDIKKQNPDDILDVKEQGKPVEIDVFHGTGRAKGETVLAEGVTENVLGKGRYNAINKEDASAFGKKIIGHTVRMQNPFIIDSDAKLKDLFGTSIPFNNKERLPLLRQARKKIEDAGHDGAIVNVPQLADVNTDGEPVKRIREIFGRTQVIEFNPKEIVPEQVTPEAEVTKGTGEISAIEKEIESISDKDIEALLDTAEETVRPETTTGFEIGDQVVPVKDNDVLKPGKITHIDSGGNITVDSMGNTSWDPDSYAKAKPGVPKSPLVTGGRGAKIPKPIEQKTAGDIISEAANSGVKGIDSALKGIHELFGGSSLRSFPGGLDKETYAKAKPHFQSALKEFINTGKSLKEFFEFMIQRFSPKIKPYLKQFVIEQRKGVPEEVAVTPEAPVNVDVGEPVEKPKEKPKKKKPKEKAEPKPKRVRLKDVGEEMFGKRSQKDNFERIKEEIKELSTGNTNKDLNRILNRAVRSKLWPIEKADRPNATPGTIRYLKMVRDSAVGVTSYAAGKLGGFSGTSKERLEEYAGIEDAPGDKKGFNEIADLVAKYENAIELLNAVTSTANTVQEAHDNILRLVGSEEFLSQIEESRAKGRSIGNAMYNLSDTGIDVMGIFSWKNGFEIFRQEKFIEEEHSEKPEPKQLRRTRVPIEELDRENVSDHRKDNPNPTPKDFQDTFGFRGVEFGEYVDSKSGRRHINLAFDSFHDLTDVLGVPVKAAGIISGVGTTGRHLGMAFGSRGRGRHSAHYEPGNHVINMTKNNGDGSLSHEWGHSLDYAVSAAQAGRDAVRDVKNALKAKYDIEAAKAIVEEILTGNSYWTRRTKSTPVEVARDFLERKWERYVKKSTDFTREARKLDPRGTYWNEPAEKFARAFEAFVYDSLEGSSPYLVTDWVNGNTTTPENGYSGNPYPQGEEREQFNRIFKHFMDGIEWSEDGRPTMKADYELVTEKERKAAKVELKKLMDKLEEMFAAMHQGKPSKDGLWWYRYTVTKRANLMQPKGFNAFDDKFKMEGEEGEGAVAYTEALLPNDILYYKLKDIVHDDDTGKVYLKEKSDAKDTEPRDLLDTAGLEGESSLGETQTEDGGGTKTGVGVPGSPDERTGEDSDSPGQPGTGGGSRPPGIGAGVADVDTSTGGKGKPELKPGSDAVLGGGNYRITESDRVGQGTINEKFTNNIAAIRTLKLIEKEARDATREEQAVLVKYVGWGGMSNAFNQFASGWRDKYKILKEALTEEEYAAARSSVLSAFYTSPEIVSSMYTALQKMGFKGGRILEPAVGTGNFFGLLPEVLAQDTQLAGVELDGISARISRQLYQRATIFHNAYEKVNLPRGFYDVALSNVPFEETIPFDKKYNTKRFKLHDYYFAKTLEMVRPGGIIGFITSAGTMDKVGDKARKLMREKADFIGAIRLPDTAFKDAGTKVTADIIFLRRKGGDGKAIPENKFVEIKQFDQGTADPESLFQGGGTKNETYNINEYFVKNPDMMLGKMSLSGRWDDSQSLISDGRDIEKALSEAIDRLPTDIYKEPKSTVEVDIADLIPNTEDLIDGSYYEEAGKLFTHIPGQEAVLYPEKTPFQKKRGKIIRSFIKLRGIRRQLLKSQAKEESEDIIQKHTKALNVAYDAFVKKHGFLNKTDNLRAIIEDPEAARILALENWNEETEEATKSDIFSKKFIQNLRPVTSVDRPADAIPHSLNAVGRVDIPFIARLAGVSEDEAIKELQGEIWNDPEQGWVISDEYLSGNIKQKIALAEQASSTDPSFKKNIEALTPLIPPDLPPSKITSNLGAPWIEPVDVQEFIRHLIPSAWHIHVDYIQELGKWVFTPRATSDAESKRQHKSSKRSVAATATWGTSRKNFFDLLDNILNGGLPTVKDKIPGSDPAQYQLNPKETDAAQAKLEAIKERFSKWIWENDKRAEKYVRKYNDIYNAVRQRKWDGSHLTFPGKVPDDIIKLTKHQKDAVWRAISSGLNTYFAHEVGTGKTFVMAATVMEAKRLGLKKKPLILGIKANVDELAENFVKLYPAARILRIDVSSNALTRKTQLNRIANNEWDAVIMSHDSFKNIQLSPEGQSSAMEEELGSLRIALALAQEQGAARFTIKQIEKKVKALESKQEELQASLNEGKIDLDFEELGVDMIVVDEAHIYKNIPYATAHSNIVGISANGSDKAFDLHMKTRWINEKYGGGIILASGTPITNSVAEVYNISRYLNPQTLRDKGIHTFDAWAAAFGNITQTPEFAPEGGGYRMVRKFKEFVNIPELRSIVREVVDVVRVADLDLKVPDILHGKPKAIVVPQNPMVEALGQEMLIRARGIRSGGVNKQHRHPDRTDIMLTVIGDGRDGAIDMRLIDPDLPDHPDTKVNYAVRNIFQAWKASEGIKGTQLVFADRGVPGKDKLFNVYDDIKNKLIKMGIPEGQIAFPRDFKNNKLKKKKLFNQVNSGEVRILIGHTNDMGVGVNVQERGTMIHNMDTEWTFEKLEQRRGRFIRQGNIMVGLDLPVAVFNYTTEGTVDAFMWDKVASKKITTEVVLFGNSEVRTVEDVSQEGMSAQEMMAMSSGDPRFLYKIELEAEVRKLNAVRGNWADEQYRLKRELGGIPGVIEAMQTGIRHREQGLKFFEGVNAVKIGDVLYDLKKHSAELGKRMGEILSPANVKKINKSPNNIPIATFGNAITKEVEGEEVTTVKTVKDIHALKKGEKLVRKERKINKVLQWNGNDISVYVRSPFSLRDSNTIDDLKIGTKTKYGEFEMTASGGLARLLANTKSAMERQSKEAREIIEKKEKEREDIQGAINKPFEQEKEHSEKTLELKKLTRELGVVLEQQQEQQAQINPDLERFKSGATDVTTEDDTNLHDDDVALSLNQKQQIRKDEKEWWNLNEAIGRAVVKNNVKEKAVLEKKLAGVNARLSKQNDVAAKKPGTGKVPATGVLADIYTDLFNEAESILGRGKVSLEIVSRAKLLKSPGVLKEARKRVPELTEELNVKGAYFGVAVDGVAVRGVIKIAIDGISDIPGMKATTRHEVFHGVFRRLLNDKDRKIILGRYSSEENAADAFAEYIANKGRLIPNSVKSVFERLVQFFERLGSLLRGRGFRSAGDIFGQAASGGLVDKASTNKAAGVDIALSIEKGVPEEDLNSEHDATRNSFEKALKSDDPVVRQYAEGLRNVITQNPMNVMGNKSHSAIVEEIYAGATNKDIKFSQRVFGLPWFLAKKFTEWKQALGIELKRSEDRNLLISEFNKRVGDLPEGVKNLHEIMALKRSEEEAVLMAIYEGDAGNIEISEEKLRKGFSLDNLGQLDKKYRGKTFKLNDSQVAAYKAWQTSMKNMRERVLDAIDKLTYLPWQNKPWLEKLKSVVKNHELQRHRQRKVETDQGKRTDFSELNEKDIPQHMKPEHVKEFIDAFNKVLPKQIRISTLRRKMGEIKGYAPRVRTGKYVVRTFDNESNVLWHDRSEKESDTRGFIDSQKKRMEEQGFVYGEDFIVSKEVEDKASEFIFDQIQAVSVERFINKALNQAKTKEKISEADIDAVSEEMIIALTDEFKRRGFASHMMKRRRGFPIGGYKIENIKKRYAEYVSGASGYITKQVAAYEYANLLRTIDINSKPDLYEDIAKYSGDMLRNQTRLDRISGRVRTAAFIWYLAGQFKSPVVNFTQNWILGIPLLEKTLGRGAKGAYHKAMYDVARRKYTDQERTFMKEMQERGITGDQLTQEIMGATQAEAGKIYEATIKKLGIFFSLSEIYNRKVSALARFRTAIEQGDSYRDAFDKSRDFVIDVHFLYGKLNAPSGARGGTPGSAVLRTSLTFRNYTFNFLHAMKDLLSERDFKTVAKSMTYMALLGGLSSLPFLDGFLDMLERNFGWSIRKEVKKELEDGGGEILATAGIQGLPALLGADIGGSLRIHFPDVTSPGKLIEESVFGVYEGLALKAVNSGRAALSGQIVRAFEIAAPVFVERPLKAIREGRAGLTTIKGKVIKEPTGRQITPTITDSVITGLGFRASRLARLSDNYRQFKNIEKFYSDWRNDIYTAFRLAKTFEARQDVIEEVMQYNRAATDEGGAVSLIRATQLKNALKNRTNKRFLAFSQ